MNLTKYLLAALAVFVVYSGLGYAIHEVILAADYEPLLGSVLRSVDEFSKRMLVLYLGNLVFSLAFCLIYVKSYERGKNWIGQGFRFGLILGTLLVPVALTEYVVFPLSAALALKWIGLGYLQIVITALVAAGLYQPQT